MGRRWARVALTGAVLLAAITQSQGQVAVDASVTLVGWVRVETAADLRSAVITVIAGDKANPEADAVNRAFRAQFPVETLVDFEGPATLQFARDRLTVSVDKRVGWCFVVTGTAEKSDPDEGAYPTVPLVGLAQYWGPTVHASEDRVFARLLPRVCTLSAGGDCDTCEIGGAGSPGCSADCDGDSCSVTCGTSSHACCGCPTSCTCCADIEQ